jgi:hypothetical protein
MLMATFLFPWRSNMQLTLKDFGELLIELDASRKEIERLRGIIMEMSEGKESGSDIQSDHKKPAHRDSATDSD